MAIPQKKGNKQIKFVILESIGIIVINVRKQGWSPTPADIIIGI